MRVGTHALVAGSRSTLWGRLAQHRGTLAGAGAGGGNHRGSVFRLHVGAALLAAHPDLPRVPTWGRGANATPAVRESERDHERRVSAYIRGLRVLWIAVDDPLGPASERGVIERGAIALLAAHARRHGLPSPGWLGHHAVSPEIRRSGLWNVRHVDDPCDPGFPDRLDRLVDRTTGTGTPC